MLTTEEERSPEAVEGELGVVELDGLVSLGGALGGHSGVKGLDRKVGNVAETEVESGPDGAECLTGCGK